MFKQLITVGYGQMASAMLSNFAGGLKPEQALSSLIVIKRELPAPAVLTELADAAIDRITVTGGDDAPGYVDNRLRPTIILLAVKPAQLSGLTGLLNKLAAAVPDAVIISVLAGVTLSQLGALFDRHSPLLIRSMPNMAAEVGQGVTVSLVNDRLTDDQKKNVDHFLGASGTHIWIEDETLMNTITAVSGSAPAYFFRLAESLTAAGIAHGLSASLSALLATRALIGAGRLLEKQSDPALWRQRITSKGGTTEAALASLHESGFGQIVASAVTAAKHRGVSLAAANDRPKQ